MRAPAMVAVVRTRTPPYSTSSRIGAAVKAATSNVTPSSATACAQMARKVSAMASASLSPWPSRSRSRVGRNGSATQRSEEHTSELQSLMRISYAGFCLKKNKKKKNKHIHKRTNRTQKNTKRMIMHQQIQNKTIRSKPNTNKEQNISRKQKWNKITM